MLAASSHRKKTSARLTWRSSAAMWPIHSFPMDMQSTAPSCWSSHAPSPPRKSTPMGEVEGRADVYAAVLDLLASGPKRLSQLLAQATGPVGNPAAMIQTLALLIGSGQVKTVRADAEIDPGPARRLNLALARGVASGRVFRVMAAPAVGTAVPAELSDFGLP